MHQLMLLLVHDIVALPLLKLKPRVWFLFLGIDSGAIESDDIAKGKRDIALQVGMEGDQKHLLHEVLPIYAQEDPYLIGLLGQEKYIDIIKKAPT